MHFWNKLSTAALMRLTILASLNLLMGRVVGDWETVLHPLFFLSILTIDLGLYALMVYSGTLNKTLIGMMLGGLVAVLGVIAYAGIGSVGLQLRRPVLGGDAAGRVAHRRGHPGPLVLALPGCPSDSWRLADRDRLRRGRSGRADPDRRRGHDRRGFCKRDPRVGIPRRLPLPLDAGAASPL